MPMHLNNGTLRDLPKDVAVPAYDRSALKPGVLHIGVGNFHRAHQAYYLDRLFNEGIDHDWGIVGSGIMPGDAAMRGRLEKQDWMSTIVELDPGGYSARVCGAMIGFAEISAPALIRAMVRPETRIVSLTVTEGGYFLDPHTGGFDLSHPSVQHDGAHPGDPQTVFGAIVAALKWRRSHGVGPFTVMSCDNVPENGAVTRRAVIGLARMIAPELVGWIDDTVAFPNGMVDCITPATGDRERAMVRERFGIEDDAVVACEPFRQWVLEDNFPFGRPSLEKVGVEFVDNVASYELMKLRILNGGHAAIAYPSALLGLSFAHEAMRTPIITAFLEKLETSEIIPTLPPVPGVDFLQYLRQTMGRFANPEIRDTIPRLCLDGSNRQPKFVLPTVLDRLKQGQPIQGLALEVALWCRFCAGSDDQGNPLTVNDDAHERLEEKARAAREDPRAFLSMTDILGPVAADETFVAAFSEKLGSLWKKGVIATLEDYLGGAGS